MGDKRGGSGKKIQKIGYVIYGIMLKFKYKVTQKPFYLLERRLSICAVTVYINGLQIYSLPRATSP